MYLKPFSLLLRNALRLGKHKGQKLDEDFQSRAFGLRRFSATTPPWVRREDT